MTAIPVLTMAIGPKHSLAAVEAGRSARGLRLTVHLHNGGPPLAAETFAATSSTDRAKAFGVFRRALPDLDEGAFGRAVLDLAVQADKSLRDRAALPRGRKARAEAAAEAARVAQGEPAEHGTSEGPDPDDAPVPEAAEGHAEDELADEPSGAAGASEAAVGAERSDDALARAFTVAHEDDLRYVPAWGKWYRFAAGTWREDRVLAVRDLARLVCREKAAECDRDEEATAVASARTVSAVVKLAEADPVHARPHSEWDADPWLLNTPVGAVDLRTGEMRPARPADSFTKCAAVAPGGECPLWLRFLDRVTDGDRDLVAFLQRIVGYALTGVIREHALFFFYGTGRNGKGRFFYAINGILADYAVTASMETFTASQNERHPTDLAMLRGARMVQSQETEEGRRWAENRIKTLTGGDPITARFMRQDFFTYEPQFKLFIAGNHKPAIRNTDLAMRRRLHLIPFTVTIPSAEADPELDEKLRAEWPGILAWAIRGCLAWQQAGLLPPARVVDATEEYFADSDTLQRWLGECCTVHPSFRATTESLWQSWKAWAEAAGEFVGTKTRLSQQLRDRGFEPDAHVGPSRLNGYAGIGVAPGAGGQ